MGRCSEERKIDQFAAVRLWKIYIQNVGQMDVTFLMKLGGHTFLLLGRRLIRSVIVIWISDGKFPEV